MDVRDGTRFIRPLWLAAGLYVAIGAPAQADPIYDAIDLGTGDVTYGVDSSGNGTVTGSSGQTYTFNPAQNVLPAQGSNTSQGVPIVVPPPTWSQDTYGNPAFAHSNSTLAFMNSQGLAAGLDHYGVAGHLGDTEAFLTQRQPDGSWGPPTPLWSGAQTFDWSGPIGVGIMGVSANGQVLGFGTPDPYGPAINTLYLYDTKTQTTTDLTSLINSMKWTSSPQLAGGQIPNWVLGSVVSQLDNQGRILVQATEGYSGPPHELLLIPQGLSAVQVPAPEPAAWVLFATLLGGWMARKRLRARHGS